MSSLVRFLASLKLAVMVILGLAAAMTGATFLESLYDTPTAQYYVYQSLWFHLLLATLGVNIFMVAAVRFPWRKSQIPFLLAHAGILILLLGSWITYRVGLDGNMRVSENETASVVQLSTSQLQIMDSERAYRVPIKWVPPGVKFKPVSTKDNGVPYDIRVTELMSHADAEYSFQPEEKTEGGQSTPALKFRVSGGPMNITQDFWLWAGDPQFSRIQAGPSTFFLVPTEKDIPPATPGRPSLGVYPLSNGGFGYRATSSSGKVVQGWFGPDKANNQTIIPEWKNVKLTFVEWHPHARPVANYKLAKVQYGQQAPPSAIRISTGTGGKDAEMWLGLGDRAVLQLPEGKQIGVAYMPEQVVLPFSVKLNRFTIGHNPGSMDPASFSSNVTVFSKEGQPRSTDISMNEPLEESGITLYQASYEDAQPRPTVSIFSVNRDPGRPWKYLGSLLITLGSILLFASKYKRKTKAVATSVPGVPGSANRPPLSVEETV